VLLLLSSCSSYAMARSVVQAKIATCCCCCCRSVRSASDAHVFDTTWSSTRCLLKVGPSILPLPAMFDVKKLRLRGDTGGVCDGPAPLSIFSSGATNAVPSTMAYLGSASCTPAPEEVLQEHTQSQW